MVKTVVVGITLMALEADIIKVEVWTQTSSVWTEAYPTANIVREFAGNKFVVRITAKNIGDVGGTLQGIFTDADTGESLGGEAYAVAPGADCYISSNTVTMLNRNMAVRCDVTP